MAVDLTIISKWKYEVNGRLSLLLGMIVGVHVLYMVADIITRWSLRHVGNKTSRQVRHIGIPGVLKTRHDHWGFKRGLGGRSDHCTLLLTESYQRTFNYNKLYQRGGIVHPLHMRPVQAEPPILYQTIDPPTSMITLNLQNKPLSAVM